MNEALRFSMRAPGPFVFELGHWFDIGHSTFGI